MLKRGEQTASTIALDDRAALTLLVITNSELPDALTLQERHYNTQTRQYTYDPPPAIRAFIGINALTRLAQTRDRAQRLAAARQVGWLSGIAMRGDVDMRIFSCPVVSSAMGDTPFYATYNNERFPDSLTLMNMQDGQDAPRYVPLISALMADETAYRGRDASLFLGAAIDPIMQGQTDVFVKAQEPTTRYVHS